MTKTTWATLALTGLLSTTAFAATNNNSTGPTDPIDNAPRTPATMDNGTQMNGTGNMNPDATDQNLPGTMKGNGGSMGGSSNGGGMSNGNGMGGSGGGGAAGGGAGGGAGGAGGSGAK